MKVYGVYYFDAYDDDMRVFADKEKAREFFEKMKNDLKGYEDEYATDTPTEYAVSTYELDVLMTYFVKFKEFEI